jgi:ATP-dependent Clp protease adaptor protein ClpS
MEIQQMEPEIDVQLDAEISELIEPKRVIMLYNDEVNTFDHVIECLLIYCNHTIEQANQISLIVHHNGKCDIKHGSFNVLKPIYEALLDNNLKVSIE